MNLNSNIKNRPIIIVGCPRSGTLLTARIIGGSNYHYLITEHSNKAKYCPEDSSGINDAMLWWNNNGYYLWDDRKKRPHIEMPIVNPENMKRIRDIYLKQADSKRLVLKNPAHLTRINLIKNMFPEAFYVFCVRDPWHTIQSMIMKGNKAYLLKTFGNYCLPEDILLKAAFSWGEAIDIYLRERDENWITIKYEDLISHAEKSIRELFTFLVIEDKQYLKKAIKLPEEKNHDYFLIKSLFNKNEYKENIIKSIEIGCKLFSYSPTLDRLPGNKIEYFKQRFRIKYKKITRYREKIFKKISNIR